MTSGTQIGLTWTQGINNGGTPVLDYKISYKTGQNPFETLATSITDLSYSAINLTPGETYSFII